MYGESHVDMDTVSIRKGLLELSNLEEHVEILVHQISQGKEVFSVVRASLRKIKEAPKESAENDHWRLACQDYLRNVSKSLSWNIFRRQLIHRRAYTELWNKTRSFDDAFSKSQIRQTAIHLCKENALLAHEASQQDNASAEPTMKIALHSKVLPDSDSPTMLNELQFLNASHIRPSSCEKEPQAKDNEPEVKENGPQVSKSREKVCQAVEKEMRKYSRTLKRDQAKLGHLRTRLLGQMGT